MQQEKEKETGRRADSVDVGVWECMCVEDDERMRASKTVREDDCTCDSRVVGEVDDIIHE